MIEKELICIQCPNSCCLTVRGEDGRFTVSGNTCPRGEAFGISEMTHPMRSLTTSVRTTFPALPALPVRTAGEIPKEKIPAVVRALSRLTVDRHVRCGDVVLRNAGDTGVNVIATLDL